MTPNPLAFVTSEDMITELRRRYPAHVIALVIAGDASQGQLEMVRTFCSDNLIIAAGLIAYLTALTNAHVVGTARGLPNTDNRFDGLDQAKP